MAERVRFELTAPCEATVFKTAAFDHSATSPSNKVFNYTHLPCIKESNLRSKSSGKHPAILTIGPLFQVQCPLIIIVPPIARGPWAFSWDIWAMAKAAHAGLDYH